MFYQTISLPIRGVAEKHNRPPRRIVMRFLEQHQWPQLLLFGVQPWQQLPGRLFAGAVCANLWWLLRLFLLFLCQKLIGSCQSGVWRYSGHNGGSYWTGNYYDLSSCYVANPRTGTCSCPTGYSATVTGGMFANNPWDRMAWICLL